MREKTVFIRQTDSGWTLVDAENTPAEPRTPCGRVRIYKSRARAAHRRIQVEREQQK